MREKKLVGITILGVVNLCLGALFLIGNINTFSNFSPEKFEEIRHLFKQQGITEEITYQQFKSTYNFVFGLSLLVVSIFAASGAGILLRREWARRLTVYFAFASALFIFFGILAQPALIKLFIAHILYLGILIVYFTNKNVERRFQKEIE